MWPMRSSSMALLKCEFCLKVVGVIMLLIAEVARMAEGTEPLSGIHCCQVQTARTQSQELCCAFEEVVVIIEYGLPHCGASAC